MNKLSRCVLLAAPALLMLWPDAWQTAVHAQGTSSSPRPRRARPQPSAQAAAKPTVKPTPAPSVVPALAPSATDLDQAPPTDKGTNPPVTDASVTSETEIIATEGAAFNSKDRTAVFNGSVRVTDPKFQLASDKLTVYLRKTSASKPPKAAAGATGTPAPLESPTPAASPAAGKEQDDSTESSGGIDHAIAEGHVVMRQDRPPATPGGEPKIAIARADKAYIDNNAGKMTLTGTPSVEQNGNLHLALSPDTVMVLNKDNSLSTKGPSRTLIIQRHGMDDLGGPSPAQGTARPKG